MNIQIKIEKSIPQKENLKTIISIKLTSPQTAFTVNNTLNLTCTFDLLIPINFAGKQFSELRIPIKVKTSYNLKN